MDKSPDVFDRFRLNGRTALVVGAGPGIGAHVAKAYLFLIGTDPDPRRMVEAGLGALHRLDAKPAERGHLEAVSALVDGEWRAAARILEDLAVANPRDILAIQVGHLIDLMVGDTRMLRDRIGRALPAWSPGMPKLAVPCSDFARK